MRRRHYSSNTESAYLYWIKRFILFHDKRHPSTLGQAEATAFLSHLARVDHVAASTQNQALAAILFLYKDTLNEPLLWLGQTHQLTRHR